MKHYAVITDGKLHPLIYNSLPKLCNEHKLSYYAVSHGKRIFKTTEVIDVEVQKRKGYNRRGNTDNLKKAFQYL